VVHTEADFSVHVSVFLASHHSINAPDSSVTDAVGALEAAASVACLVPFLQLND
jgi:hypothetical protein